MRSLLCVLLCLSLSGGVLDPAHRSGDYQFNLAAPPPPPADVCSFRWRSGVEFIARYSDNKGNLRRHGGMPPSAMARDRSLLVIHVGKTGGSSLLRMLRAAGVPHSDVHLFSVREDIIRSYDSIVVTVRDPLERTISAFNWDNPWSESGRAHRKKNFSHFYHHFPNINAYAENLTADTALGAVARRAEGHIALDTCYYVGGVIDTLRRHGNVFVVDAASFQEDITQLSNRLGWNLDFRSSIPMVNKAQKDISVTCLTEKNEERLRGHLSYIGEYEIFHTLRKFFGVVNSHDGKKT